MTNPKLNFLRLPMRPMEKECTFYMQIGSCAYGANCRFDHPDPMPASDPEPGNSLANVYSLKVDNNFPKTNETMHFSGVSNSVNSSNFTPYAPDITPTIKEYPEILNGARTRLLIHSNLRTYQRNKTLQPITNI